MSPERVATEMREGVRTGTLAFTAAADLETVISLYTRGFVAAFESYTTVREGNEPCLYYKRLGWGPEEAVVLAEALAYARGHCILPEGGLAIKLNYNQFGPEGTAAIERAVEGSRFRLIFHSNAPLAWIDLISDLGPDGPRSALQVQPRPASEDADGDGENKPACTEPAFGVVGGETVD